jgi:hypothetical protein
MSYRRIAADRRDFVERLIGAGDRLALVLARNARVRSGVRHHGFTTSREVTTKSVRSVPHCEQRNRSAVSGTSPRPASMSAWRFGGSLVAARGAQHDRRFERFTPVAAGDAVASYRKRRGSKRRTHAKCG